MKTTVISRSPGCTAARALRHVAAGPLALLLGICGAGAAHGAGEPGGRDRPLAFEANRGQVDSRVKFLARAPGYTVFLTPGEAVLSFRDQRRGRAVVRMSLAGANPSPALRGVDELAGRVSYARRGAPGLEVVDLPTYASVRYAEVLPGVDLVFYGRGGHLEYDFVLAPGADPGAIALAFEGAERIEIDAGGDLVLHTGAGEIRQPRPVIYQQIDGARRLVAGGFALTDRGRVGFRVGAYDPDRPLVIDPVLLYSSYLGGSSDESEPIFGNPTSIAVDAAGNIYVTGLTMSVDFPTTPGADRTLDGDTDAFVTKLSPTGAVMYSTYLGGPCDDHGRGIAVDAAGNAYVTGRADGGFCFAEVRPGALVAKLDPAGTPVYYQTFGGQWADTSFGQAIALDAHGHAYITGLTTSPDFPTTPGAYRTASCDSFFADGFVAKVNGTTGALIYSTYLCGDDHESPNDIAVDAAGNAYVAGSTQSHDFPAVNALLDHHPGGPGGVTGFVAKLNAAGSDLLYSTYLGGSVADVVQGIAVDALGHAYVAGVTQSSDFPTTPGVLQPTAGPRFCLSELCTDAFVAKLAPGGSTLVYSTYLFGEGHDGATRIAVDAGGNAYVTGETSSIYFPILDAFQTANRGLSDAFVVKLSPDAARLVYSSYLGGGRRPESMFYTEGADAAIDISLDPAGNAYVTGYTSSLNFPVTPGAYQPNPGGGDCFLGEPCGDAFVSKIAANGPGVIPPVHLIATPAEVPPGGTVTATWAGIPAASSEDEIRLYPLGEDDAVGFWPTTGAAAGTLALTLPGDLPFGTYELRFWSLDPAAMYWAAVARSHPIRVGAAAPAADLVVTDIAWTPAQPIAGQAVQVAVTVANQGTGAAGSFAVDFYKHRTTAPTPGMTGDLRCTLAGLAAAATAQCAGTVTYAAAGAFTAWAQVDTAQIVAESGEANNVAGPRAITVTAPIARPDLVETALSNPPALAKPGTGFSLTHTVRNQGAAAAGASTTRFRLSRDTQKSADDLLLTGTHAVPALAPGATSGKTLTATIPAGTPLGTYFVLACADDAQAVAEDSETNNCRAAAGTVVVALPDLVQQAVSSPAGPFRPGARLTVSDTAFNDSPMATGKSVTTKYFFSVNDTRDAGDKLLTGSRTIANLAAFKGSSGSVTVTIPSSTVPRTYTLLACTDATGGLTEASETNNCRASATPVVVAW